MNRERVPCMKKILFCELYRTRNWNCSGLMQWIGPEVTVAVQTARNGNIDGTFMCNKVLQCIFSSANSIHIGPPISICHLYSHILMVSVQFNRWTIVRMGTRIRWSVFFNLNPFIIHYWSLSLGKWEQSPTIHNKMICNIETDGFHQLFCANVSTGK